MENPKKKKSKKIKSNKIKIESEIDPNRIKAANIIIASPESYQVCDGCDSILSIDVGICPLCNHYHFIKDSNSIIKQAKILSMSPQKSLMDLNLTKRKV